MHPDLLSLENVLLVPHLASGTTETRTAMADLAVDNVLAVLAGRPPLTPVPDAHVTEERAFRRCTLKLKASRPSERLVLR